jgi:hypothetical protein
VQFGVGAVQRLPQPPQLLESVSVSKQPVAQAVSPGVLQTSLHAPLMHAGVALVYGPHTWLQPPQLSGSFSSFTQPLMPQKFRPDWHPQRPPKQTVPVGHLVPHMPQLLGSFCSLTQLGPQRLRPDWHPQTPPEQNPDGHVLPHPPQFVLSVSSLTHLPPQKERPDGQPQTPAEHVAPDGQTLPQFPQLLGSFCSSAQNDDDPLPHMLKPLPQVAEQLPFEHTCPGGHAVLHAPQLLLSVCSLTHPPAQFVRPD